MILFGILYLLSISAFLIHYYRSPASSRTTATAIEIFLLYQLVFGVGLTSLIAFIGLYFLPEHTAEYTGWAFCPFQLELANVNLAYFVLGILCIWFRKGFWLAVTLGFSIWIFGDALHHIYDGLVNQIHSKGNEGFLFFTDLIFPLVLCGNFYLYTKYSDPDF